MFAVTVTTFILWATYRVLPGSWPISVSNVVCLCLSLAIVVRRLKSGDGTSQSIPGWRGN